MTANNANPPRDDLKVRYARRILSRTPSVISLLILVYCVTLALSFPFSDLQSFAFGIVLLPALVWISSHDFATLEIPDLAVLFVVSASGVFRALEFGLSNVFARELLVATMLTATVWFVGGLFYRRLGREAIGIGDAKLLGAGSLAVGMPSLAAMVFVACVGGIIAGLLARRTEALPTTQGVPFGPFVAYSVFLFVLHPYPGLTQP